MARLLHFLSGCMDLPPPQPIQPRAPASAGPDAARHGDSMWSALVRVIDAGQKLLGDRIDLGRLEVQDALSRTLGQLGVLLGGIMLVICGWVGLTVALALWLREARVPLPASLLGAGLVTAAIGAFLIRAVTRPDQTSGREERDG
ncbi:MAG: phage holin family protein [Deltaproteobacteria bacterium]|nr:phage holin family protein [Deltaproteobacteria bacterium]